MSDQSGGIQKKGGIRRFIYWAVKETDKKNAISQQTAGKSAGD
jgi:hypothetical protein